MAAVHRLIFQNFRSKNIVILDSRILRKRVGGTCCKRYVQNCFFALLAVKSKYDVTMYKLMSISLAIYLYLIINEERNDCALKSKCAYKASL